MLPFLIVGSISTVLSLLLMLTIPPSDPDSQFSTTPGTNESQNTQILSSCGGQDDKNSSSYGSTSSESHQDEGDATRPLVENGSTSNGDAATPHDVQLGYALNYFIRQKSILDSSMSLTIVSY